MAKKLSPITPGDILLEEFLSPMDITQSQLAKDINVHHRQSSGVQHATPRQQLFLLESHKSLCELQFCISKVPPRNPSVGLRIFWDRHLLRFVF